MIAYIVTDKITPVVVIGQEGKSFLLRTKDDIIRSDDIHFQLSTAIAVYYERIKQQAKLL